MRKKRVTSVETFIHRGGSFQNRPPPQAYLQHEYEGEDDRHGGKRERYLIPDIPLKETTVMCHLRLHMHKKNKVWMRVFTLTESSTDCASTSTAMPRLKKGCWVMSYILARNPPFSERQIQGQSYCSGGAERLRWIFFTAQLSYSHCCSTAWFLYMYEVDAADVWMVWNVTW